MTQRLKLCHAKYINHLVLIKRKLQILSPGPRHCRPRVADDDLRVHNLQPRARNRAEGPRRARSRLGERAFAGLSFLLFVLFPLFFRSMCNAISAVVSGARARPSGCTGGRASAFTYRVCFCFASGECNLYTKQSTAAACQSAFFHLRFSTICARGTQRGELSIASAAYKCTHILRPPLK